MPRSFSAILSGVFLVSVMAILTVAAPVQAAMQYRLVATSLDPSTGSDFSLSFLDNDEDGRMSMDELVPDTFTGVYLYSHHYVLGGPPTGRYVVGDEWGWQFKNVLLEVPSNEERYGGVIPKAFCDGEGGWIWQVYGVVVWGGIPGCTDWGDGTEARGLDARGWSYASSEVPLPPTVFLLGAGLIGLVGLRRFRKS